MVWRVGVCFLLSNHYTTYFISSSFNCRLITNELFIGPENSKPLTIVVVEWVVKWDGGRDYNKRIANLITHGWRKERLEIEALFFVDPLYVFTFQIAGGLTNRPWGNK